jgi:hypothetical protein
MSAAIDGALDRDIPIDWALFGEREGHQKSCFRPHQKASSCSPLVTLSPRSGKARGRSGVARLESKVRRARTNFRRSNG